MYNYLYKFHLLKPASANSQVTLVTCSGAFKNPRFRKVWFYLVKRPLLGANVSKTPVPQPPRPCRSLPPRGVPGGSVFALFGPLCRQDRWSSRRKSCQAVSTRRAVVFLAAADRFVLLSSFREVRGCLRTPKILQNHCTVVDFQGFAESVKVAFRDLFGEPLGSLLAQFWSSLGSSGRSGYSLRDSKGAKSPKRCQK